MREGQVNIVCYTGGGASEEFPEDNLSKRDTSYLFLLHLVVNRRPSYVLQSAH